MAIDLTTLKRLGKRTGAEIKADNVGLLASAAAFRIFLSIFPSLIAVVAVFGLVTEPGEIAGLLAESRAVLPGGAYELLERTLTRVVEDGAGGGFALVGVAGGVWAAASAAAVLIKALNAAYEVEESRNFLKQRLTALILTLVLLAAIFGLLALLVLGRYLQAWLIPAALEGRGLEYVVVAARIAASVLLLVLLFAVVYWIGPNRQPRHFKWITPGSVVAVFAWLALSGLFALYTRWFGNYSATYGSLAGAVVTLLWLQLTMMSLLAGAELNQVWERHFRGQRRGASTVPPD